MPHYITLLTYTQKGVENIKHSGKRTDAARKAFAAAGGKMHTIYLTMGRFDAVVISEFPDDETAARVTLSIAAQGNVHTETLRAFTEEQGRKITASVK